MRDYLKPHFQPILDQRGKIHALEAFMRLTGDLSGTARFVPRWERTSLIGAAELSMIELVRGMVSQPYLRGQMRVHVNLSAFSIVTGQKQITEELARSLPFTKGITAEIPHAAAKENYQKLLEFVKLCKYAKISTALDGAELNMAFTNKRILEEIRPEYVKIDCRYIIRIRETSAFECLIRTLEHASSIGIRTIVKNIESDEGYKTSILVGAKLFQGRQIYRESASIPQKYDEDNPAASRIYNLRSRQGRLARVLAPARKRFGLID